ncbi:MAG: TIGR03862 family flavoprotein [Undibacterium sp.]|nr:TIGR03862 family flavoprotein [Undibacterium sp.]
MNKNRNALVLVIGAGPAGLMAAEQIALAGFQVEVMDAMPSAGRKFLLAGKSGMNLTHSENFDAFIQRYRGRQQELAPILEEFPAEAVRAWAQQLGIATFVGSSGRVFPVDMKAAPLLRAWLSRLRSLGVLFSMRHRWQGWNAEGALCFEYNGEALMRRPDAVVLALGGASWARLGSDGAWQTCLGERGIKVSPLLASNCGFLLSWSAHMKEKCAGMPLTNVIAHVRDVNGEFISKQGQCVITESGIEGSLIYALSAPLRELLVRDGYAQLNLDLLPGNGSEAVLQTLSASRGSRSLSSHLKSKLGLHSVHIALLYEVLSKTALQDPQILAQTIKALPLCLMGTSPMDEAISCAGGLHFSELDQKLMLKSLPGIFCAGEMLDWDAPTGGYLLNACFASGYVAGRGVLTFLDQK